MAVRRPRGLGHSEVVGSQRLPCESLGGAQTRRRSMSCWKSDARCERVPKLGAQSERRTRGGQRCGHRGVRAVAIGTFVQLDTLSVTNLRPRSTRRERASWPSTSSSRRVRAYFRKSSRNHVSYLSFSNTLSSSSNTFRRVGATLEFESLSSSS